MFLQIAAVLVSAGAVVILVRLIFMLIKQHKTNQILKKTSPNLPVPYELMSIFGGHIRKIQYAHKNTLLIDKLHRKYGKTYGTYYCNQVWVCTTDIDLIKAVVIDEPYKNVNRFRAGIPIDEITVDSIASAEDGQWRRIRQAFAPSLA